MIVQGLAFALRAWRAVTPRQWAWTTAIAIVFLLANVSGLLPPMLRLVPIVIGREPGALTISQLAGMLIVGLATGYCLLLATSLVEYRCGGDIPPPRLYAIAAVGACAAVVLIEVALYTLFPPLSRFGAKPWDSGQVIGGMIWSAANFVPSWGLALLVYVRLRLSLRARAAFDAAELERIDASRAVLVSRLEAMRARIEPQFLLGTLAHVEDLYDRDHAAGDRMLDRLIDYLHAALPQLRSERSTLKTEVELAEHYLSIVQIRMGSRLEYRVEVPAQLGDCQFPPMVLLPLVDDALRRGLDPLPVAGWIAIVATGDGNCLSVSIADNGLPRGACIGPETSIAVLKERLAGLYGDNARLIVEPRQPHGVVATIEVPLGDPRNHC